MRLREIRKEREKLNNYFNKNKHLLKLDYVNDYYKNKLEHLLSRGAYEMGEFDRQSEIVSRNILLQKPCQNSIDLSLLPHIASEEIYKRNKNLYLTLLKDNII